MGTNRQLPAQKSFDLSRYKSRNEITEMEVKIGDDKFIISVRQLPWFEKSEITSACMTFSDKGEPELNTGTYVREVLKRVVVDAPWFGDGVDVITDDFLNSINGELGQALEQLVPNAFTDEFSEVEVLKKES